MASKTTKNQAPVRNKTPEDLKTLRKNMAYTLAFAAFAITADKGTAFYLAHNMSMRSYDGAMVIAGVTFAGTAAAYSLYGSLHNASKLLRSPGGAQKQPKDTDGK